MDVLKRIFEQKKSRLKEAKSRCSLAEIKARALDSPPSRDFLSSIRRAPDEPIKYIGELKKASPSKGLIRADFNPVEIARIYSKEGASAISVLTEEDFFQGSLEYLKAVRQEVQIPLLRKDFLFDEYQLYEARAWGADAVLLIGAMLSRSQAEELYHLCNELG
ncbi:MAG: indole-3-glycerol-phosphate synthase, partial [Nitrospirae bacterium]